MILEQTCPFNTVQSIIYTLSVVFSETLEPLHSRFRLVDCIFRTLCYASDVDWKSFGKSERRIERPAPFTTALTEHSEAGEDGL